MPEQTFNVFYYNQGVVDFSEEDGLTNITVSRNHKNWGNFDYQDARKLKTVLGWRIIKVPDENDVLEMSLLEQWN